MIGLLVFFPLNSVFAQQPLLPPGASAEIIERQVLEKSQKELEQEKALEKFILEEQGKPPIQKGGPLVKFYVRRIILEGDLLLDPVLTQPLLTAYEQKEITQDDLAALSESLQEFYRKHGYFVVVYLAPQRVQDGNVKLMVLATRSGELFVEGNRWFRQKKISSYWRPKPGEVLKVDEVHSSVFELNQNPDRSVQPVLKAGKEPGTTDIYLKVKDHFPLHAGFNFDNQGVKLTGKQRAGFTVRHNNFLTLDDTFSIGTVFGNEFGVLFLNHLLPLNTRGTRLSTSFSHAQVNPKKEFELFGINGTSETYGLALHQRFLATQRFYGDAYIGFDFKEKKNRVLSETATRDRLRVLSLGADFQAYDSTGYWTMGQSVHFGFSPHGDGYALTSRQAESSFFKYVFSLKRLQHLPWGTTAVASLNGQLSPDKLTPQEEMFFGGAASVRGYPESDYGADQGILGRLEYLTPFFLVPGDWHLPFLKEPLRKVIQPLVFFDYGYGRLRDPLASESRSRQLAGAGAGLNFRVSKHFSARTEWAVRMGDRPLTEGGNSQFHFRLNTDI